MKKEIVLEIIRKRWSPYSFSSEPVEEFKLKTILEAAKFAPSSRNEQPWMFMIATREDTDTFNDYLDFLEESNRLWACNAYALVISLARTKLKYNDGPNKYAFYDTGMAVGNMLLQAVSMDIYVHQMGGFSVDMVKKYFNLDEDVEPVAVMALGYYGDGTGIPEELSERDKKRRSRKDITEYAFKERLNNPAF